MRVILDCNDEADLTHCLALARDMLAKGEEGDVWGYWAQRNPDFSALLRFNKASVSVRGRRKSSTAAVTSSPARSIQSGPANHVSTGTAVSDGKARHD